MEIEALDLGARAYGVLKRIGIDTVEDLCPLTREQLLALGNFGKKSFEEVNQALAEHSLSLQSGPANPRVLLSYPGAGVRFNLGLSTSNTDAKSLARYTVRELSHIEERLKQIAEHMDGRTQRQVSSVIGHAAILRQVHETFLAGNSEQPRLEQPEADRD